MTREEAIKHLMTYSTTNGSGQTTQAEHEEAKNMAIVALKDAWIPCSERLPDKNGRFLATRGLKAAGDLWNRVYIINYSDLMGLKAERIWWEGNVGKSDFKNIDDVVAWMPLPEPYREEDES